MQRNNDYECSVAVVTPTYDRANSLPRLYRSLCEQTFTNFEWIVVDDGSTDDTELIVREWQSDSPFPIRYFRQEHGGRHIAVNRGVREARTEYCAVIDSDDWYVRNALERMIYHWSALEAGEKEEFANVEGLCAYEDGSLVGDRLPSNVLDSNNFELVAKFKVRGDKKGMYRTEILRMFPFPEAKGVFISEDSVFFKVAESFRSRFVNEIWAYNEYRPDGISAAIGRDKKRFAPGLLLQQETLIALRLKKPPSLVLRSYANLVRYSLHAGRGPRAQVSAARSPLLWATMVPVGVFLYLKDEISARRNAAGVLS
jgi:glycosyltransferase involved in cell wall biosynthesis